MPLRLLLTFMLIGFASLASGYDADYFKEKLQKRDATYKDPSKVEVLFFTMYQAPRAHYFFKEMLPQLKSEYGDKVNFVHIPLAKNHHQNQAKAFYLVEDLEFSESVHDKLFASFGSNPHKYKNMEDIRSLLSELGINTKNLDKGSLSDKVKRAIKRGNLYKVSTAPTLVIDRYTTIDGTAALSIKEVKLRIEEAIKEL